MAQGVLLIAAVEGIESCTRSMEDELQVKVDVARSRSEGLDALRCMEYAVVVIEESLAAGDPAWADEAWELSGFAVPLQTAVPGGAGGDGTPRPRTGGRATFGRHRDRE